MRFAQAGDLRNSPGCPFLLGLDKKRTVPGETPPRRRLVPARTRYGPAAAAISDGLRSHEPCALSDRRFRDLARLRHASAYREAGHPRVPRDSHAITGW